MKTPPHAPVHGLPRSSCEPQFRAGALLTAIQHLQLDRLLVAVPSFRCNRPIVWTVSLRLRARAMASSVIMMLLSLSASLLAVFSRQEAPVRSHVGAAPAAALYRASGLVVCWACSAAWR